jgi:ElaB/YqjD/DUF883 family membrane-anchored ribosome-binding protein
MSVLSGIFMGIGLIQMLVTVGKSTATYNKDKDDLDGQITNAQTELENFKNTYDKILKNTAQFDSVVQQKMKDNLNNILQLQTQLKDTKDNAIVRYRSIQLAGIIFVVTIAMLFILKGFGFFAAIENAIVGLFTSKKKK